MAKGREKQIREKLAKAQRKLADLEEMLALVQIEGEERVRVARERADKRIAKARKRVDRQAHVVAEREAKLSALVAPRTTQGDVPSPEAAVAVLEHVIVKDVGEDGLMATAPGGGEVPLIVPTDVDGLESEPRIETLE